MRGNSLATGDCTGCVMDEARLAARYRPRVRVSNVEGAQRAMTALKPLALRHRSGGRADLYFEYSRGDAWSWEHRIMKEASHALEQGVGVRAEVDFV